ncbi:unnamed protein product [Citrullus colocynthis]|uniref:Uncharacterized protein n=1 Tax=Citrullus colocynthis TaxID=252529 RepID=A0ABP0YQ46_9ROSI
MRHRPQNWPGCEAIPEPPKLGDPSQEKENHVEKKRIISIKSNQFFCSILLFPLRIISFRSFLNPPDKDFLLISFLQFPISLCIPFPLSLNSSSIILCFLLIPSKSIPLPLCKT